MKKLAILILLLSTVNFAVAQCGDTNPPTITLLGINPQVIEICSAYSELGANANDLCDGNLTPSIIINSTAVNTSVIGSYPVTYDVIDADGNNAIQIIRTVMVVNDTTNPNAICQNATVVLDAAGNGSITTTDIDNGSNDACGIASLALDTTAFGCGDIGNNTVTLTVTDNNGNVSTCTATVDVQDNTNPNAICQNATVVLDAAGNGSITTTDIDNGSNDACGIASLTLDTTAFGCGDIGNNTVTLTVTDNNGNVSTCTATVDVQDNTNPNAICQNATVVLDAAGNGSITTTDIDNGSNDACGIASLALDTTTFGCADIGNNTVTLTVTDNNGNVSTCTATVDVQDNTNPNAICQNATVVLDAAGNGSITTTDIDNGSNDACGIASLALDTTAFGCGDIGNNTVTLTVTDNNGNVSTCTATVDVQDNTNPNAICQNATVVLDAAGNGSITTTDIDNGSNDACGIASLALDTTAFGCGDIGNNTVTLTVTDNNGNVSTCTATVDVQDNTNPNAICQNATVVLDAAGNGSITTTDIDNGSNDACGIASLALDTTAFGCGDIGNNTVTLTVTDNNGNVSTCTATVDVQDNTNPNAICQNATVVLDAAGNGSITTTDIDNGSNDACGIASLALDTTAFGCGDIGNNTVTLTVTDNNGNVSTCTATVDVQDNTNPNAICQNATVVLDAAGNGSITTTDIDNGSNDACGIASLALDTTAFGCGDIGNNTVTLTVTDNNGNVSTCTATVDVQDNTNPNAICQNATVVLDAAGNGSITTTDIDNGSNDACGIASLALDTTAFGCGDIGNNTVTLTVTDNNGNVSTCTATVDVQDNTNPNAICQNATVVLDAAGNGSITTTDIDNGSNDACGIASLALDTTAFGCGDIGNNTVTLTVTDNNGNVSTCTATVDVQDNTNPNAICQNATVVLDAAGNGSITTTDIDNGSNDACGIASLALDTTAFGCGDIGNNTVTLTVTDNNGNVSTCTATVDVQDNTNPNAICQNATVVLDAAGNGSITTTDIDNGSNDACGIASLALDTTAFGCGDIGNNTVTLTVTDNNGNVSTCTATVDVQDNTNPNAICQNATVVLDAAGNGSITTTDIDNGSNDACGIASLALDTTAFGCGDIGNNTVTLTVTDNNGNVSTCTATVDVQDNTNPNAICQNATVVLDAAGNGSITTTDIDNGSNDACGIASLALDTTAFGCGDVGNNTVTLTVTDNNGNVSTCTATVDVQDNTNPNAICQNATVVLDAAGNGSITTTDIDNGSNDACGIASLALDTTAFGCGDIGNNTVTLTVTDNNGNVSTCTATVDVQDNTNPTAICQDITVQLDPDGTIAISPLDVDGGSNDNCGIVNRSVNPSMFDCSNIGNNTITLTVTDTNGNTSTCTANVLVQDITPPNSGCGSISLTLDAITGQATISDINALYTGTGDSCSSVTLSLAQTVFGCNDIGINQIPLTITDASGNSSSCNVEVTVIAPTITSGTLTGEVVNPIPDNPVPPSELIEVTACPGGVLVTKDVQLTLNLDASSTIIASNISIWQTSTDDGLTWTDVAGTAGLTQYTLIGLSDTTLVRIVIQSGNCSTISPIAIIRFLPPDEPPVIINTSSLNICLNDQVTINAESYYEYASQFGEGGFFNYAQPEDWRVDGIDGFFPASGNNADEPTWKETNGPKILSGIRYDVVDNTKFAAANGPYYTTLETPIFNTIGMTASEASLEFYQAYYFCNGGEGLIELSFDGGVSYNVILTTDQGDNYTAPSDSGFSVTSIANCNSSNNGQHPNTDPLQFASIDLSAYLNMAGLRVRFTFDALGTSECTNSYFPPGSGNTCNNIPSNFDVYSSWVIDNVGFPYAPIDEILEWTDEDGGIIATGSTVSVTPITPGIQDVGVTSLVNGCRADGDAGTEFVTIATSLAYAGRDIIPIALECGQSSINLKAYDNTATAVQNYNDGSWENGLYIVPNVSMGDNDYPGTGVTGQWSILNPITTGCGSSTTLSSLTNPRATFTADPGTYTLRWTLQNGCFDDVNITINSCSTIDFDGINDFITFKQNYSISSDFSLELWVKPNDINGTRTVFSKRLSSDTTKGYNLNIENGVVKFYWYSSSGNGSMASQYNIDTSRWYHLAVTFDGTYKLFIDGISVGGSVVGSENAPEATTSNVEALLGAIDEDNGNNNSVGNFYRGWIDELRIWNKAISVDQIRQMMNQEIEQNSVNVRGTVVPLDIPGLNWTDLDGYYRMNTTCGNLSSYKGASGRIRNITTSQDESAPLPYTSRVDGQNWATDNTWTHFSVWDAPNSIGIDGSTPIDWNIAQISHNINSHNKDIIVLGLISDTTNKVLKIADPFTTQDETNDGQSLRVTHYLELNGILDLVGESQLLQDQNSVLAASSSGKLERDQQGSANLYNYNYWSSPVTLTGSASNNGNYSVAQVLNDGTNTNAPLPANWSTNHNANPSTTPITMSNRWLYAYENFPIDSYASWRALNEGDLLATGLSFTMKGSGVGGNPFSGVQNYAFIGKPNNGTISTPITIGNQALVGNPYASAIDADEFIRDNIPGGNAGTSQSIDGTLYFWEHYTSNFTHVLEDYEGGYAAYNLSGAVAAVSPPLVSGNGTPTKLPGRYVPVTQGFFVSASNLGGSVTFHNDQRTFIRETSGNSTFMRSSGVNVSEETVNNEIQRIRLEFKTPEGALRPLLLGFVPNNLATDAFDYGYDAENSDEGLPNDMSWMIGDKVYVIQGVGEFDIDKQYPFGLFLSTSGNIEIALKELENFENPIDVFVYDSLLGTYTQINDLNYQMSLDANDYVDRFYITFTEDDTLSTIDTELQQVLVNYLNDSNEIYIHSPHITVKNVHLINIIGQTIASWKLENTTNAYDSEIRIPVKNLSEGTYIIKVQTESGFINKKVLIKM